MRKGDTKSRTEGTLTRREALAISARYGAAVASVGFAYMLGEGALSFAEAAAGEAEKKAKAKFILTMGLDGTINLFPKRPVAKNSTWIHGTPEFKAFIEEHSKGRIYVDMHDAGALGSQTTALKKVQQGIIQGASCSTQNAAQLAPIWNVLDVPYTIGPVENAWKVIFSREFNDTVRANSEQRRLTAAYIMPYMRWLEMSPHVDKDIRKPEDLSGLKISRDRIQAGAGGIRDSSVQSYAGRMVGSLYGTQGWGGRRHPCGGNLGLRWWNGARRRPDCRYEMDV